MGGSVGASSGVNSLSYSQLISQLNGIGNSDVICLKDGQLGVWKAEGVGVNTPNTSEVKNAVFEAIKGKLGAGSSGVENAKKLLLGHVGGENGNGMTGSELREILAQIKDLNAQQVEKKPEFALPEVGTTISMSRDELEKNIKGWLEAGYRVNVKTVNKGTFQLLSGVENKKYEYKARQIPGDGHNNASTFTFTLPEKSSFTVSQASVAKLGEKPGVEISERLSVGVQTKASNTCFLWCLFNSYGLAKNKSAYAQNAQFFEQPDKGKVRVFTEKGPEEIDVKTLMEEVKKAGDKGEEFLKKLAQLREGFERNLVLYCYARNVNGYRGSFNKWNGFPIAESTFAAPLLGLELKDQVQINFVSADKKSFKPANMGENVQTGNELEKIRKCLERDELVTLNLDGVHFVTVKSINKDNTVTCLDSSGGVEKTQTLEQLAASYESHGEKRVLSFSSFGPKQGDRIAGNLDNILDFVEEIVVADGKTPKEPKSLLMKELLKKCNGNLETCAENCDLKQIMAFKNHVAPARQLRGEIISKVKKNDSAQFCFSIPLTGNESDSAVNFLSNIVACLFALEEVDGKFKMDHIEKGTR